MRRRNIRRFGRSRPISRIAKPLVLTVLFMTVSGLGMAATPAITAGAVASYDSPVTIASAGLAYSSGIAIDSNDDVFVADGDRIAELPKTGDGYSPQIDLPFTGLISPRGVALDDEWRRVRGE